MALLATQVHKSCLFKRVDGGFLIQYLLKINFLPT
jgi:hypothetical protein